MPLLRHLVQLTFLSELEAQIKCLLSLQLCYNHFKMMIVKILKFP